MKISDLELYRWKIHNDVYMKLKTTNDFKRHLSRGMFWRDHGAFVSILPRQSGKTTMLVNMSRYFDNTGQKYILMVMNINEMKHIMHHFKIRSSNIFLPEPNSMSGLKHSDINLMIDEFMCIDNRMLDKILDYDWKSVTLTSTLVYK